MPAPGITYNPRKSEVVITDLDLSEALPKISRLPYKWDSAQRKLTITVPGNDRVHVFKHSVIVLPPVWQSAPACGTPVFRSKTLVIFEIKQRSQVGYTIAVRDAEAA